MVNVLLSNQHIFGAGEDLCKLRRQYLNDTDIYSFTLFPEKNSQNLLSYQTPFYH